MRVMFTLQPGTGHLHPLVPLAKGLSDAGHEVMFACAASFRWQVEASGFRALPAGLDWSMGDPNHPRPVPELPPGAPSWAFWITQCARPMVSDLLAMTRDWMPDVIVHDPAEYAAAVVAERLGIPHATVAVGAWVSDYQRRLEVTSLLEELRADSGLSSDPETAMPFRYLHLAFMPRRYRDPARTLAPTTHFLRPTLFDRSGTETLPPWIADLPDRPTVYATLGTASNYRTDIFDAFLTGLREEPVTLILTIGRQQDRARFGPQPENVHIEGYVPQSLLLPRCDTVISQAGFSTVLGALSHGLPLVVLPLAADQPFHAERCTALGVGRVIEPAEITAETVREAVSAVLADARYRRNAQRLRDEMAELPGLDHAVALVERLARDKSPIMAAY